MTAPQELYDAGRPPSGYALTHEPLSGTFHESAGRLPRGFIRDGEVIRDYAWKPFTSRVRLRIGEAKTRFDGQAELLIPAILAESLETLGGKTPVVEDIAKLPFRNVVGLMLDRLTEDRGRLPVVRGWTCQRCHKPIQDIFRDEVEATWFDWVPEYPPRAVAWLERPFDYRGKVDALLVECASWKRLMRGLTQAQMMSRDILAVRSATCGIQGYFSDGQFHAAVVPSEVAEGLIWAGDATTLEAAANATAGHIEPGVVVPHTGEGGCGQETVVPFDWMSGH